MYPRARRRHFCRRSALARAPTMVHPQNKENARGNRETTTNSNISSFLPQESFWKVCQSIPLLRKHPKLAAALFQGATGKLVVDEYASELASTARTILKQPKNSLASLVVAYACLRARREQQDVKLLHHLVLQTETRFAKNPQASRDLLLQACRSVARSLQHSTVVLDDISSLQFVAHNDDPFPKLVVVQSKTTTTSLKAIQAVSIYWQAFYATLKVVVSGCASAYTDWLGDTSDSSAWLSRMVSILVPSLTTALVLGAKDIQPHVLRFHRLVAKHDSVAAQCILVLAKNANVCYAGTLPWIKEVCTLARDEYATMGRHVDHHCHDDESAYLEYCAHRALQLATSKACTCSSPSCWFVGACYKFRHDECNETPRFVTLCLALFFVGLDIKKSLQQGDESLSIDRVDRLVEQFPVALSQDDVRKSSVLVWCKLLTKLGLPQVLYEHKEDAASTSLAAARVLEHVVAPLCHRVLAWNLDEARTDFWWNVHAECYIRAASARQTQGRSWNATKLVRACAKAPDAVVRKVAKFLSHASRISADQDDLLQAIASCQASVDLFARVGNADLATRYAVLASLYAKAEDYSRATTSMTQALLVSEAPVTSWRVLAALVPSMDSSHDQVQSLERLARKWTRYLHQAAKPNCLMDEMQGSKPSITILAVCSMATLAEGIDATRLCDWVHTALEDDSRSHAVYCMARLTVQPEDSVAQQAVDCVQGDDDENLALRLCLHSLLLSKRLAAGKERVLLSDMDLMEARVRQMELDLVHSAVWSVLLLADALTARGMEMAAAMLLSRCRKLNQISKDEKMDATSLELVLAARVDGVREASSLPSFVGDANQLVRSITKTIAHVHTASTLGETGRIWDQLERLQHEVTKSDISDALPLAQIALAAGCATFKLRLGLYNEALHFHKECYELVKGLEDEVPLPFAGHLERLKHRCMLDIASCYDTMGNYRKGQAYLRSLMGGEERTIPGLLKSLQDSDEPAERQTLRLFLSLLRKRTPLDKVIEEASAMRGWSRPDTESTFDQAEVERALDHAVGKWNSEGRAS